MIEIKPERFLALLGFCFFAAWHLGAQTLINGAGSTFDYPAFTKWFEIYRGVDSNVSFNYQSIGSGAGQKLLLNQTVDFGASDAPMSVETMSTAPAPIIQLPIVAGGVAIIYNLPGDPRLKLDGPTLAAIFLGEITSWNDPKIAALNPGLNLPDVSIIPIHRADGSGTSYIFTDYLSTISPEWKQTVGKGSSVHWPSGIGLAAKGSEGVAGQVKQLPGGIAYAELAYADQSKIPFASIQNTSGQYVLPSPASVSAALATAAIPDDFRFSIVNSPGREAYPISGASWVLVYKAARNPGSGTPLASFLKWAITRGQTNCASLDYAPLPETVQQREIKILDTVN